MASSGTDQVVLTREAVRRLDRLAVERYHIPSVVLMENAGRGAAEEAFGMLGGEGGEALILCGPGNNGGDGFACARHLHNMGVRVRLCLLAEDERYGGDAGTNLRIARAMGLAAEPFEGEGPDPARDGADLVIDAIFGTGLTRRVEGRFARAVEACNAFAERGRAVLALDLPSGLDADTGRPLGVAVRAARTLTLEAMKPGLLGAHAREYTGEVRVAPIGVPRELTLALGGGGGTSPA